MIHAAKQIRDAWERFVSGVEEYREGNATNVLLKEDRGFKRMQQAMTDMEVSLSDLSSDDQAVRLHIAALQGFTKGAELFADGNGRLFLDNMHWNDEEKSDMEGAVKGIEEAAEARLLHRKG